MSNLNLVRITEASEEAVEGINRLLPQLTTSGRTITRRELEEILRNKNLHLILVREEEKTIGMGTIVLVHTVNGFTGTIEDIVVDEAHRGRGIGERIMRHLMDIAKQAGATGVKLTSRPTREAANALYQKLGFEKKETNVYVYTFKKP